MSEAPALSDLGQAARECAARGWAVFPLAPRTKVPTSGSRGFYEATRDPGAVVAAWLRTPDANVGIATGAVSGGLCVVDVDPRNGGDFALETLEAKHGALPLTVRQQTGGGGWHLLFKLPPGTTARCGVLCPGVEFKSDGGYIVGPLSIHPKTGERYGWEATSGPDDVELAELPAWVLTTLAGKGQAPGPAGASDAATSFLGAAFEAAGWLGKRLADGRRAVLCPWKHEHTSGGDYDTSTILFPPRTGDTLGWFKCSHSHCCSRGSREVMLALPRAARDAAEKVYPKPLHTTPEPPGVATGPAPTKSELLPVVWAPALAEPLPRFEWLCKSLGLMKGRPVALSGYGDAGKTYAAQEMLLAVATNRAQVWGSLPIQLSGPVLHVDFEQQLDITRWRYQRLAHGFGVPLGELGERLGVISLPPLSLVDPRAEEELVKRCQGTALVLIDNLCAGAPGIDENSSAIAAPLYMLNRVAARTGAVILVIHHERKTSEGMTNAPAAQRLRGSSAIHAALGGAVSFVKDKDHVITVEQTKATMGPADEAAKFRLVDVGELDPNTDKTVGIRLEWIPEEQAAEMGQVAGPDSPFLSRARNDVLRALKRNPGGLTKNKLREVVRGSKDLQDEAVIVLLEEGYIIQKDGPNRSSLFHLAPDPATE